MFGGGDGGGIDRRLCYCLFMIVANSNVTVHDTAVIDKHLNLFPPLLTLSLYTPSLRHGYTLHFFLAVVA